MADTTTGVITGSPFLPTPPAPPAGTATPTVEKKEPAPVAAPKVELEPEEIDYKAELAKAQKELDQARYTLKKKNIESKKAPVEEVEVDEEPEAVPDDLDEKVNAIVNKRVETLLAENSTSVLENTLAQIEDEDERELTRFKYENAIAKTGFSPTAIANDIENARILANAPKLLKRNKEMALALKAKRSLGTQGMGSNLDRPTPTDDPKDFFTAAEWQLMENTKVSEDTIKALVAQKKAAR